MEQSTFTEKDFGRGALDRPEHYLPPTQQQSEDHFNVFKVLHDAWEKLTDEEKTAQKEPIFVDYPALPHHNEIARAMQPAVWIEKTMADFVTYPKRSQGAADDCVCYWLAKQIGVDNLAVNGVYRELSPHSVYPFVFVAGGGCNSIDAAKFVQNNGISLESLYPSDNLTEAQVEDGSGYSPDAKVVAQVFKPKGFALTPTDFESLASILYSFQQQGIKKVLGVTIIGINNGTWMSTFPQPPAYAGEAGVWFHKIVITDFGLINGQKVLSFDNTFGPTAGNGGQQFLTESYAPYIYGGQYSLSQSKADVENIPKPPVYTWSAQLSAGATGPDVTALQQALQSLGMFPISSLISPTGYFGGITQNGVKEFQAAFALPITGIVDSLTITQLNKIFGA